jgi:hypothetical protein
MMDSGNRLNQAVVPLPGSLQSGQLTLNLGPHSGVTGVPVWGCSAPRVIADALKTSAPIAWITTPRYRGRLGQGTICCTLTLTGPINQLRVFQEFFVKEIWCFN